MKVSLLKEILSYGWPIRIHTADGITTPRLGLYRYSGRWQLSAATALYSDGAAYTPLKKAFKKLNQWNQRNEMLVLGAGLGSAVSVLHKMKQPIHTTLVEIDPKIIEWGKKIIPQSKDFPCKWICADVLRYVDEAPKGHFDLIVLDVFIDRIVPQFATSIGFLKKCAALLADEKSIMVFNYIINNDTEWEKAQQNIHEVFSVVDCIELGINRVLLLKRNA